MRSCSENAANSRVSLCSPSMLVDEARRLLLKPARKGLPDGRTPSETMVCKIKSWLSQIDSIIQCLDD